MKLRVITGGRAAALPASEPRVLHPRASLSIRAGITPIPVPGDMWMAAELVAAMSAPRVLRAVA